MSARRPHSADELAAIRRIRAGERAPITLVVVRENPAVAAQLRKEIRDDAEELTADDLAALGARPRTRGDCVDGPRPCPWAGCRYHLLLDVGTDSGSIKMNHLDLDACPETCALDVADRGEHTLEQIGDLLAVVRERIRQIDRDATEALHVAMRRAGIRPGDESFAHPTTNLP